MQKKQNGKIPTGEEREAARLDAIVEEASRLTLEQQQYILATIKGMLLAHEQARRQEQPPADS